jgi:CheY-like chemotaxis protein
MNKLTYIDNCELDQFILRKILSRYGSTFEVNSAGSGNEILAQLSKQYFNGDSLTDIIVFDIYSPDFNAWKFLDNLQMLYPKLAKPVEVYVLSATKYPRDVERLKKYGFVKAFIMKPITKEIFLRLIRQKELAISRFLTLESFN